MRFILFFVFLGGGTALILYAFPLVKMTGPLDFAEKYLGTGGTYTAWKLLGLILIIASFWVLVHGV